MQFNILYLVFILATAMCTTSSHPISNIRSRASLYPVAPRPRGLQGRADHADSSAGSTRKPKWIDVLFDEIFGQRDESFDSEVFEFLANIPAIVRFENISTHANTRFRWKTMPFSVPNLPYIEFTLQDPETGRTLIVRMNKKDKFHNYEIFVGGNTEPIAKVGDINLT
ncbi:hypothetical protein EV361DRAFT_312758 [Lentinula raphanica]|uniref:Uncharacterized protein n=1 Tax=Lentinula raphanica TaxID=153919 RepID=A0AA38P7Y3_9AGAR|nr:hypothetical protein F5880DRAFT_643487 [Lentinula raphanica]KAJ3837696.1 hypothetical protein F5878DRAFT_203270 [Lentinula raphanica]KAJ3970027.1 hypothetical protein EV361DRAFT_312758 [Lentinula raphanica]